MNFFPTLIPVRLALVVPVLAWLVFFSGAPISPNLSAQGHKKGKPIIVEKLINELGMTFVLFREQKIAFGVHEVTKGQFAHFAEETNLNHELWRNRITAAGLAQEDNHPVVNINWQEATDFCQWLTQRENRVYRLPTDYEWSLAAGLTAEVGHLSPAERSQKAPNQFFWGDSWSKVAASGNYADKSHLSITSRKDCFPFDDKFPGTAPVGSFPGNLMGIHDMGGNVSEWVYDWYHGRDQFKTLRGASYRSGTSDQKIHYKGFRSKGDPKLRSDYYGFRVVVEIEADDPIMLTKPDLKMASAASTGAAVPDLNQPEAAPDNMAVNFGYSDVPNPISAPVIPEDGGETPLFSRKKIYTTYTKSDGVNLRKDKTFSSDSILGSLHKQFTIPLEQVGPETQVDTETWIKIEVKGWIPTKNSTHTYLEDKGDGTWRVTWNKPGDRYVAMRTGTTSDHALISKVQYDTVVERLDTKEISNRHYILGKFSGWAVKRNQSKSFFADIK